MNLKKEMLALTPQLRAHAWVLSRGAADADDLVQQTLIRAWQGRDTFDPSMSLRAWMFRILRTVFLASLAGQLGGTRDPCDGLFRPGPQAVDPEWRLRFDELLESLAALPDQECEALLLVAGSGLSYEEAADVCYCSASSIKLRVSRARRLLAELEEVPASAASPRAAPSSVSMTA